MWHKLCECTDTWIVIFVTHSNMTSAAPSFSFFPFWKQSQHHRERHKGGHVWKVYRDYINHLIWFDLKIQYNLIGTTKISDLRMVMRSLFFSRIKIIFWKVLRMDILIYIFYLPWSDNFDLFELPSIVGSGHNSDVIQEMDDW